MNQIPARISRRQGVASCRRSCELRELVSVRVALSLKPEVVDVIHQIRLVRSHLSISFVVLAEYVFVRHEYFIWGLLRLIDRLLGCALLFAVGSRNGLKWLLGFEG